MKPDDERVSYERSHKRDDAEVYSKKDHYGADNIAPGELRVPPPRHAGDAPACAGWGDAGPEWCPGNMLCAAYAPAGALAGSVAGALHSTHPGDGPPG